MAFIGVEARFSVMKKRARRFLATRAPCLQFAFEEARWLEIQILIDPREAGVAELLKVLPNFRIHDP